VIKHAPHNFDIDVPGKDSYEIRQAGAQQVLVSSSRLMALVEVQSNAQIEPGLSSLVPRLDCSNLDLILVEGFKDEAIAKVELHRSSLDKPLLYPSDQNIIAIASDQPLALTRDIEQLDINDIDAIADYLAHFIESWTH
jgi:molybdopterin-guanine dinucleotide biosynthesis protein MobB